MRRNKCFVLNVAVTDGKMEVAGNPASMSDTAGNLLFYSNRYKVWTVWNE